MSFYDSPMPLADIESVLAWVDTFKLSRPTKKINRDFSDAVLLAEILCIHYPKLVEMHNYPPRNSHSLKLNNWMTLNRKVLKKLRLSLCCNTMEQLANSTPGVIERILVMVREKIRRDEELNKSSKEEGTNMSSGGSYYEAMDNDDNILVVPVKTRVNGVLETVQEKVVTYKAYMAAKEELKDAIDAAFVLKQKVEHLDNLLKLKDERINELQHQLERKQARRKEVETQQNHCTYDTIATSPQISSENITKQDSKSSFKTIESQKQIKNFDTKARNRDNHESRPPKDLVKQISTPSITEVKDLELTGLKAVHKSASDVLKDINFSNDGISAISPDVDMFVDSEQDCIITIEQTIQKEIKEIIEPTDSTSSMKTSQSE